MSNRSSLEALAWGYGLIEGPRGGTVFKTRVDTPGLPAPLARI
ncbi:MAG: hypothetical protein QF570_10050 [Myxococcota bacterium]|jgi:hypothetical protein|nr:hypothetical protein [Myxococcota bacterium]